MLKHQNNYLCCVLLKWYTQRLFANHFRQISLRGRVGFDRDWGRARKDGGPIIFYGNHQTWWDGFFYVHMLWHYGFEYAIMMEAKNLRKYWFFRKVGVFGVNLDSILDRGRGAQYAINWLSETSAKKRRALVIFPHGRLVPEYEAFPAFKPGLHKMVERIKGAVAIPILTQINYCEHRLPNVDLLIGEALHHDKMPIAAAYEQSLLNIRNSAANYFDAHNGFSEEKIWSSVLK